MSALGKSAVPACITVWPGRNFSVAGFGVDSVWMNMVPPETWTLSAPAARLRQGSLESF